MTSAFFRLQIALLAIVGLVFTGATVYANPAIQGYLNHEALTQQLVALDQSELVTLTSIGKSQGGRNLWVVTVGTGKGPAIAVIGNVQGGHLVGGEICLRMAQRLVALAGTDESVRAILDAHTFYFIPRPDPDACEKAFVGPWKMPAGNDRKTDDDRDFSFGEDPPEDLNKDGWITMMRVADETGTMMPHPDDPRVLIAAETQKNERGQFRVYVEGIDNDGDEKWNEDASDGVSLDRNFPFRYVPFEAQHGPNAVSEPESRALADFMFDHTNIAFVMSFSPEENLLNPWKPNNDRERQRIRTTVLGADAPSLDFLSGEYKKRTGIQEGPAGSEIAGTFSSWAYFHLGKWSVSARGWSVPKVEPEGDAKPSDKRAEDDLNALRWLKQQSLHGFADWTPFEHPDFPGKKVEIGGFRPFYLLNPPSKELDGLGEKHVQFLIGIPPLLPKVAVADTRVEVLGGNVVRITAKTVNRGFLATMPEVGQVNGQPNTIQIELTVPEGSKFLQGSPRQRVSRLKGNGGNQETIWLVRLPSVAGTKLSVKLSAPAVGASVSEIEIKAAGS